VEKSQKLHDHRGKGSIVRRIGYVLAAVTLAVVMLAGSALLLAPDPSPRAAAPTALGPAAPADVEQAVVALQERLRALPNDARGWATLAVGYVEQARITGDPTYYPKAEQALDQASRMAPGDDLVLTGLGVLAAARHEFDAALRWADRALAVNPYGAEAHLVRVDALVELGRYDAAAAAARRADAVQPGLPSFARLSYLAELHGDLTTGMRLMGRALAAARRPSDVAFTRLHLGDLARQSGRLDAAAEHYDAALAAVPSHVPAMVGQARVALARGNSAAALPLLEEAARRMPLPEHLVLLAETYESLGRREEAAAQYAVVRATVALAGRHGVGTDLETALFEADHGDPAVSLAAARREWARRHSVHAADALAWALHANGRDREALGYARSATRLGTRDAAFLLHRGLIQASLGEREAARRDLTVALQADAGFSLWQRSQAGKALAGLGARP